MHGFASRDVAAEEQEPASSSWGATWSLGGLLGGGLVTAFQELTEDASKSVAEISSAVQAWNAGWAATSCLPRRGEAGRGKSIDPAQQALRDLQAALSRHTGFSSSEEDECEPGTDVEDGDDLIERVWRPVAVLIDDVGGPSVLVPSALTLFVAPCLTPAHSVLSVVAMSSFGVPLRGLVLTVAIFSAMGMVTQWNRYPEDSERSLQRRGGAVFGLCVAYQLWMVVAGGAFPMRVAMPIAHPQIVQHCLLDLLCGPPVILNLGYLVGCSRRQMLPTVGVAALGQASFLAAAVFPGTLRSLTIFGLGVCFMMESAVDLTHDLPAKAIAFDGTERQRAEQRKRAQMSADLVCFSWASLCGVELLGLLHVLPASAMLPCFLTCDILGKMGACHLLSKTRETVVVANRASRLQDGREAR